MLRLLTIHYDLIRCSHFDNHFFFYDEPDLQDWHYDFFFRLDDTGTDASYFLISFSFVLVWRNI